MVKFFDVQSRKTKQRILCPTERAHICAGLVCSTLSTPHDSFLYTQKISPGGITRNKTISESLKSALGKQLECSHADAKS